MIRTKREDITTNVKRILKNTTSLIEWHTHKKRKAKRKEGEYNLSTLRTDKDIDQVALFYCFFVFWFFLPEDMHREREGRKH